MAVILNRDETIEVFRLAVLHALDTAARTAFAPKAARQLGGVGATDADLPRLFKAIDAQVDILAERFDFIPS